MLNDLMIWRSTMRQRQSIPVTPRRRFVPIDPTTLKQFLARRA